MYSKIFMIFLLFNLCDCNFLFELGKVFPNELHSSTTIEYYSVLKLPIIKFYKKTYNRHTNFVLEKNKENPTFGEIYAFSPLSHCDNEYNKNLAIQCLEDNPINWGCIYDACISPSKPKFHYVKIILPSLYKDNNITNTCDSII